MSAQIQRIGDGVLTFGLRRVERHFGLQVTDHLAGHSVLDVEDVFGGMVVGVGPDMCIGPGVDELRRDAQRVAGLAHGTLEHVTDVQSPGDLGRSDVHAFERKRGRSRDHPQPFDPRQQVKEFLR